MKESSGFRHLLRHSGFHSFLWTQFLGAFNDNAYKIVVSMRAVDVAASASSAYLSLAGVVFVLPFLLFSGYSGHLSDAVSKRKVLIGVKIFEIAVMALGFAAFFTTRMEFMLVVLFLMALHSTIFSPAKYGIVPEMLPDRELSRANALLEMSTFVAIVVGTSVGSYLFTAWKDQAWKMGLVMVAVAVVGFLTSLKITAVAPAGASTLRLNPFSEVVTGTKHFLQDRPLMLTVMGISYFWFLGALLQMDLLLFGKEVLRVDELRVGLMLTSLAVGIGAGSMLAGRLSGDKVELGLVPLGSILMSCFGVGLYLARASYGWSIAMLSLLGLASGLFIVPLNAFLQQRSEQGEKGRMIATNNFYNTVGILIASGVLWTFHDKLNVSPDKLILLTGVLTLLVTIYIVTIIPEFLVRFVLWMLTHTFYRVRVLGQENLPFRGPALLVANHTSYVDGFLISACVQRFIRFMVWRPIYEAKGLHWFLKLTKAIPTGGTRPRDAVESIRRARQELKDGHVVCIFAEGAITRTGHLLPFKRGLEKIIDGADAPVIPVHLDGVWGSIFSFERGRFLWKWPRRIPYPVTVTFGKPLHAPSAHEARQAILELASEAVAKRASADDLLHVRFVRAARRNWRSFAMADSTGRELSYGKAVVGSMLVAGWLRNHRRNEEMIGVLLPPTVAGALVNLGIALAGKTSVNLNYTAGREGMTSAVGQCRLRTIVTSKTFLEKAGIEATEGMFWIEDILSSAGATAKVHALLSARFAPLRTLRAGRTPDSLATVIFSSGSTGTPKGVMLSHYNVLSNIDGIRQVFSIGEKDRVIGVLPFFHSFGFTVTVWLPVVTGCGVAYHSNPMEAKTVGTLVSKYKGTFLLSTPTFCVNYMRKISKEEFASLRFVIVGAEKLRESVAKGFRETFGLDLLEGYGCTELAPVISFNVPDFESGADSQTGAKPGTVGRPVPGIAVRVVDPATMEPMPPGAEGLLLVKGSNRMIGYLGQPERTREVLHEGWYITGDIATVDEDGFIRVTDRLSRFSKIGGEMVPHVKVEEALSALFGEHSCVVTGIPDEQRGEKLVVLYTHPEIAPADVWRRLSETDLPKLWLPKRENIYQVKSLPTLGSGKLDLRAVKAMAQELAGIKVSS